MRTPEEIAADCLRVSDLIAMLGQAATEVGDSPVAFQNEDGGEEYPFVEVTTANGDIWVIVRDL